MNTIHDDHMTPATLNPPQTKKWTTLNPPQTQKKWELSKSLEVSSVLPSTKLFGWSATGDRRCRGARVGSELEADSATPVGTWEELLLFRRIPWKKWCCWLYKWEGTLQLSSFFFNVQLHDEGVAKWLGRKFLVKGLSGPLSFKFILCTNLLYRTAVQEVVWTKTESHQKSRLEALRCRRSQCFRQEICRTVIFSPQSNFPPQRCRPCCMVFFLLVLLVVLLLLFCCRYCCHRAYC